MWSVVNTIGGYYEEDNVYIDDGFYGGGCFVCASIPNGPDANGVRVTAAGG
ncbi:hypothetical protein AGMMS50268_30340 [Spirochaetia bacterium]|nr:hypothetical protein AGMMS50268_30340 [Spirochaetia bacterium]